jgi:hypothetical protein
MICDGLSIGKILLSRTVLTAIVLFPVFHEKTLNLIASFEQPERAHG